MMTTRHQRAVSAGLLAVAVAALPGCDDGDDAGSVTLETTIQTASSATVGTKPATGSIPAGDGSIEPGTHQVPASPWSVADFTVTFPEGWKVQYGHVYSKNAETEDEIVFYAVVVDEIYADACAGSASGLATDIGPTVDDLAAALLEQPGPVASEPVDITLGGYRGVQIDLTVPEDLDLTACNLYEDGFLGLQVWYSRPADKYLVLSPGNEASVYILDVNGERQVVLAGSQSITYFQVEAELRAVLDSIRFEP